MPLIPERFTRKAGVQTAGMEKPSNTQQDHLERARNPQEVDLYRTNGSPTTSETAWVEKPPNTQQDHLERAR